MAEVNNLYQLVRRKSLSLSLWERKLGEMTLVRAAAERNTKYVTAKNNQKSDYWKSTCKNVG
jgi:hypothetical protein